MTTAPTSQPNSTLRYGPPYLILVTALVITALATLFVQRTSQTREELRFQMAMVESRRAIEDQMRTNVSLLQSGAGLFAASGHVSPEEFHRYAERVDHGHIYRGIQGIGFTRRILPAERDRIKAEMARYVPNFRFWSDDPRAEPHAILYLEPLDPLNRRAIGYNMYSEPVRRAAMAMARDTGAVAASGRVRLKQEGTEGRQNGFLIYVPVYRGGGVPASVEARRRDLVGFVYSPIRMDDFVRGAFEGNENTHVEMDIWDNPSRAPGTLLYAGASAMESPPRRPLVRNATIRAPGHEWSVRFVSTPAFHTASERVSVPLVFVSGLIISALLFSISMMQARSRAAAEIAAVEIRRSEEAVRAGQEDLERLYAEAQTARAAAEEANRLKDDFLATVSHELRTPLNAIMGYAQLLRIAPRGPEDTRRALEAIERNVKAQAQLIEDLLDVSRIISGKMRLEVERVDLEQVIQRARESVAPAAAAKDIRLDVCVDENAGPVHGDPSRLQQVVWNLLANATKFTNPGGRVSVRAVPVDGHVEIVVEDSGVGISPESLSHIFDRFRQGDSSTTRGHGGLGLGLSIVRNIVEMHGGTVHAESDGENRGARFIVRLPLSERDVVPSGPRAVPAVLNAAGARTRARRPDGPDLEGLRVLVVDDEADARLLMEEILGAYGAEVRSEPSAAEALAALASFRPHVLVSDIAMPGEDGYSLIRKIRALAPERGGNVPAAALTAFARAEDRSRALHAGFHMHIPKPIEPNDLATVVAGLTGRV